MTFDAQEISQAVLDVLATSGLRSPRYRDLRLSKCERLEIAGAVVDRLGEMRERQRSAARALFDAPVH